MSSFSAERAVMEKSRWRSRPQAGAAGRGRRGGGCGEATEEFAAAALQMAAGAKDWRAQRGQRAERRQHLSANSPMQCGVSEQSGGGGDRIRLFDRARTPRAPAN